MQRRFLSLLLATCGLFLMPDSPAAHGGQWRGPGDTVPPGGSGSGPGGGLSGPSGPNSGPTSGPGGLSGTPGRPGSPTANPQGPFSSAGMPDLDTTLWSFWWEFNKDGYLALRQHVHGSGPESGSGNYFLGEGERRREVTLRPGEADIRGKVVPALVRVLETASNPDQVTGAMMALAKIGDAPSEDATSELLPFFLPFLANASQEISETASVALGILAHHDAIAPLVELMNDSPGGRLLVGRSEVPLRTRAFAAYGLSLVGARSKEPVACVRVVQELIATLEQDKSASRDLSVACLASLGLVPLAATVESTVQGTVTDLAGQIAYVRGYLDEASRPHLVRAHAPVTLARLVSALRDGERPAAKERHARHFASLLEERKVQVEIQQGLALALGLLADDDDSELDNELRRVLVDASANARDKQTKAFALISLAKAGSNRGDDETDPGGVLARDLLMKKLLRTNTSQSWAALALGVHAHALRDDAQGGELLELQRSLRRTFSSEKNPDTRGALSVAMGLAGDVEAVELLLEAFQNERAGGTRGYLALGLGLLGERAAIEPIRAVLAASQYRPELLLQAAIALGLLGDKTVVSELCTMLSEARGLASQAAIASALGTIGDRHAIDPLLAMLENEGISETARGFAAVALGLVADKELLPWNAKIGENLNYQAATPTLNDASGAGNGILNIL